MIGKTTFKARDVSAVELLAAERDSLRKQIDSMKNNVAAEQRRAQAFASERDLAERSARELRRELDKLQKIVSAARAAGFVHQNT